MNKEMNITDCIDRNRIKDHLFAVVMAGGKGERFWPLGRKARPKQLLPLLGEKTMIEESVQRLFPLISPERLLVITNQSCVQEMRNLLPVPAENIIGEPVGRDTAPCVALAVAKVSERDPEATMILLPADHVINPAKVFQEVLLSAAMQAQEGYLVTLGITPTFPSTGYGYIHVGQKVSQNFSRSLGFREKPDQKTAEQFFSSGNYKWNSGMFLWRVDVIANAFEKYSPELYHKIQKWSGGSDYTEDFAECQKISIDYAIMEKADNVLVGDSPFYWNDIGSWSALRSVINPDENGNSIRGNVIAVESENNVVISDDDSLIGVIGMSDIAIINSGNGILVCPLAKEQMVKQLVNEISNRMDSFL